MNPVWAMFPYPTLGEGELTDGSIMDAHPDCTKCTTMPCTQDESSPPGEVRVCRFGLGYARVDAERVVLGFVARDVQNQTQKSRARIRNERSRQVPSKSIQKSVARVRQLGPGVVEDFALHREELIRRMEEDPTFRNSLLEKITRDIDVSAQQGHDFLQLVKLVKGYAEELLRALDAQSDLVETAEAHEVEGSIYFATEMMAQKLDALEYLQDPILARTRSRKFKIHPMLTKYVRIYDWKARQKRLTIARPGECYETVDYDDRAIGVVIQGILDNLVKYAPSGSHATIGFDVQGSRVTIKFSSLGPRIEPSESTRIFQIGVRGAAARGLDTDGQGVGLATALQISDAVGLNLAFEQNAQEDMRFPGFYTTTFRIELAGT